MAFATTRARAEQLSHARDESTQGSELVTLAASRDADVRAAVAGRRDCPMASMLALAHDGDVKVLLALLGNPSGPAAIAEQLVDHRKSAVRAAARSRLGHRQPR